MSDSDLVELIDTMPDGIKLLPYPEQEFARVGGEASAFWSMCFAHAAIRNKSGEIAAIAGLFRPSLVSGQVELWVLLCETEEKSYRSSLLVWRGLLDWVQESYSHLITRVREDYTVGIRFVQHFGFKPTGMSYNGYQIFERS